MRLACLILASVGINAGSLEDCIASGSGGCSPQDGPMATCQAACNRAGHCCDGSTWATSNQLLSCRNGCEMAWFAKDLEECEAHCFSGNRAGCSYNHPEAGRFHMCNNCQAGCGGSESREECARGCRFALQSNEFYNDLHYTSPPAPPPAPYTACRVPTGTSAAFRLNMIGGYWSASAVFDDEPFSYVSTRAEDLRNERGLICVDDESTPRNSIALFDGGFGGDDEANDGIYTRSCLRICPGKLAALGVTEDCINCGGTGEELLGIMSAKLRGGFTIQQMVDLTPYSQLGCKTMHMTSHGIFGVCPDLMPAFPNLERHGGAWAVQAPNRCAPCRKAWDHLGDAFDFFSIRGRYALRGAGDNYIRVNDTVPGIGWPSNEIGRERWGFDSRQCTTSSRMQGVAWGQYPRGYTHELAHWLGLDFNANGRLPQYDVAAGGDGAHLQGGCTIHGPAALFNAPQIIL